MHRFKGAAVLFALTAIASYEVQAETQTYTIEAQSLSTALREFARQTGVQIAVQSELTVGKTAPTLQGQYEPTVALSALLSGSGLVAYQVNETTYGIRPIGLQKISSAPADAENRLLRVAQAEGASSPSASGETPDASGNSLEILQEIIVTGTHIRGSDNPTAPLIVMDREYIESTGFATTTQLIESLPQNFALVNQSAAGGSFSGNSFSNIQGSTISLRGMGEGTTLTLVNGRRMPLSYDGSAVNIVALPLSAIERVEVLTDGASALYGSDAVGGVVNFVLRQDFEGAESGARFGHANGSDEYRLSQVLGHSWESGNVVFSAEHYQRAMLSARERDFGIDGFTSVESLLPKEDTYAATLFARQHLTPEVDLFLDVLYTNRDSFNRSFELTPVSDADLFIDNWQFSAATGVGWDLGAAWRAELSASYGEDNFANDISNPPSVFRTFRSDIIAKIKGADFKLDGPVADLPGGAFRTAFGGQWREESLDSSGFATDQDGLVVFPNNFVKDRRVTSLFAEAAVPLIGEANAVSGVRRLDLSLAVRYDDYSDFGSSVDPRIALAWSPVAGLKLRGSWGTSYLAPKMKDYDVAFNAGFGAEDFLLANGLTILQVVGNAPESLKAQESTNYTVGLDWMPLSLPRAKFTLNYFSIEYKDKIASLDDVSFDAILADPAAYGDVLILNPSLDQVNQYIAYGEAGGLPFFGFNPDFSVDPDFDRSAVEAIFDYRRRNIGVLETTGVDFSAAYGLTAAGGDVQLGLDVAYILDLDRQVTSTSTALEILDTYANPTKLKLRASVGYRRGGWSANGFLNRKSSYTDNRFAPFVDIDSYTTVDANVSYRFDETRGALSNVTVMLGAVNLFDQDPPDVRVRPTLGFYDMGFDPANASPLGRLLTVDLTKRW